MGDAAAAAVLVRTPEGEGSCLHHAAFATFAASGAELTRLQGGGTRRHPNDPSTTPEMNLFEMHGPQVFRLASAHAVFATAFAKRGLIAEHGIAWMLPRIVGHAHATDLLLTSRKIDAAEALAMGLVHRVVPADALPGAALALARSLSHEVSPRSVRVMKRQLWESPFQTLGDAVASANAEMVQSLRSEDFKEGVAHFIEKRAPRFTGA